MEGRIVAICDVFDALTSERPYKKEWPIEKAIQELKDNSGVHFDPNLVDKLIGILPQILVIKELCQDKPSLKKLDSSEVTQHAKTG